jgi:cell fate (sporulation/competence/biofilm development) regulator YlbF (YheA/YmcA/DUF963 family)
MHIYDKANELAALIKRSEQFSLYKQLKDEVYSIDANKALLSEYKRLQLKAQSAYMTGDEPDQKSVERMQKLGEVLQFNENISEFLIAEYKFNTLVGDIYKIIGDACEIDMDIFKE